MPRDTTTPAKGNGANLGFEANLWRATDALRSNMDAAEYKHVVLGLIFLKYISDAFEEQQYLRARPTCAARKYKPNWGSRYRATDIKREGHPVRRSEPAHH